MPSSTPIQIPSLNNNNTDEQILNMKPTNSLNLTDFVNNTTTNIENIDEKLLSTTKSVDDENIETKPILISGLLQSKEEKKKNFRANKISPLYMNSQLPRGKIVHVSIGWSNPEEIRRLAVCDVSESTLYDKNVPRPNGLYDLRMGPHNNEFNCGTCKGDVCTCLGHIAKMELPLPVFQIKALPETLYCLQGTCPSCSCALLQPNHPKYAKIMAIKNLRERAYESAKITSKFEFCGGPPDPNVKFDIKKYTSELENGTPNIGCHARLPVWSIYRTEIVSGERVIKVDRRRSKKIEKLKEKENLLLSKCKTKSKSKNQCKNNLYDDSDDDNEGESGERNKKSKNKKSKIDQIKKTNIKKQNQQRKFKNRSSRHNENENESDSDSDCVDVGVSDTDDEQEHEQRGQEEELEEDEIDDMDIEIEKNDDDHEEGEEDEFGDNDNNEDNNQDDDDMMMIDNDEDENGIDLDLDIDRDPDINDETDEDDNQTDPKSNNSKKRKTSLSSSVSSLKKDIDDDNEDSENDDENEPFTKQKNEITEKERNNIKKLLESRHGTGRQFNFTAYDAHNIFKRIRNIDLPILGFNTLGDVRPEYLIMTVLPVSPPCTRISNIGVNDGKNRAETDTTRHYRRIVIYVNELRELINNCKPHVNPLTVKKILEYHSRVQKAIAGLVDNEAKGTKIKGHNKMLMKSIIHQWTGKEGLIRGCTTAKRSNFCGRSVISPGIDLDVDQIGVPESICKKDTYPEKVTRYNIEELRRTVLRGPDVHPGAVNVIKPNGEVIDLRYMRNRRASNVQIGWTVERHLRNGDVVIFGRQPSLHKMSLMGMRVFVHKGSTILVHLSATTPYNADFDGDEMNLYVPQNEEARAEALLLMKTDWQILDPQDKACMGFVQDSQIAAQLITSRDQFHTREEVLMFVSKMEYWNGHHRPNGGLKNPAIINIKRPKDAESKSESEIEVECLWTGKQAVSMILPGNYYPDPNEQDPEESDHDQMRNKITGIQYMNYSRGMNKISDIMNDTNSILVDRSEILVGRLNKSIVGPMRGGFVQEICHDFGVERCRQYISDGQRYLNNWIHWYGFGISLADCPGEYSQQIDDLTNKMIEFLETFDHKIAIVREAVIRKALEKLFQTIGNLVSYEAPGGYVNRYLELIRSGAKGSLTNFCQTVGILGQQIISGSRLDLVYNGTRAFPHFEPNSKNPIALGFVPENFRRGLSITSFFAHAMAGREGLVDTAAKTAPTGYLNRRVGRATEDTIVDQDMTVRDGKNIVQFSYGGNNWNTCQVETQYYPCDIDNYKTVIDKFYYDLPHSEREDDQKLKKELQEEVEMISQDILKLRLMKLSFNNTEIDNFVKCPVSFARYIKNAKQINDENQNQDQKQKVAIVTPQYVLTNVKQLIEYCRRKVKNDASGLQVFEALVRVHLCVKHIVGDLRMSTFIFDRLIKQLKKKFHTSLIQAGDTVGSIGAQSIGQPTLQMTLNTFHLAGVGSASMTAAIPKLEEIIVAKQDKKKVPNSMIYVPLKPEYQSESKSKSIFKSLKPAKLSKFLISKECQILFDQNIWKSKLSEDQDTIDNSLFIYDQEEDKGRFKNLSCAVIRFVFNRKLCIEYGSRLEEIVHRLKKIFSSPDHLWIVSNENAKKWIIRLHVNIASDEFMKYTQKRLNKRSTQLKVINHDVLLGSESELKHESDSKSESESQQSISLLSLNNSNLNKISRSSLPATSSLPSTSPIIINTTNIISPTTINEIDTLHQIRKLLMNTIVHGIEGITNGFISSEPSIQLNSKLLPRPKPKVKAKAKSKSKSLEESNNNVIYLSGYIPISHLLSNPAIDSKRLMTNNLRQVEDTFGIEVATLTIIYEVRRLFTQNGSYVNESHIHILANTLTRSGAIVGFGINGYHASASLGFMKKITFERILKTLMDAATSGETDTMINVASNILVGNAPPIGTNFTTLFSSSKHFEARQHIIAQNEFILSQRLAPPLESEDIVRLIPTLQNDSNLMDIIKMVPQNGDFQYETYKKNILEKNCRLVTPNYDHLTTLCHTHVDNNVNSINHNEHTNDIDDIASVSKLSFQTIYQPLFYNRDKEKNDNTDQEFDDVRKINNNWFQAFDILHNLEYSKLKQENDLQFDYTNIKLLPLIGDTFNTNKIINGANGADGCSSDIKNDDGFALVASTLKQKNSLKGRHKKTLKRLREASAAAAILATLDENQNESDNDEDNDDRNFKKSKKEKQIIDNKDKKCNLIRLSITDMLKSNF